VTVLSGTVQLTRGESVLHPAPEPVLADDLIGRNRELKLIGAFLGRLRTAGEALLLAGEAGVGKSALLDAAARMASAGGFRVLRADGAEFEAGLGFSALHQVLLPLRGELEQVSPVHREALSAALGFGAGPAPERLTVSNGVLELLRRAAEARPVLLVADDLPWLDRASAAVLGFVARRLTVTRVGLLAASRSGQDTLFERSGLSELDLGPLDEESSSALMNACFPVLAPGVRDRLLAEAHGNPLALLELPAALSEPQLTAVQALPPVLPLGRRLQALFAARVEQLPVQTRHLLLMAAAVALIARSGDELAATVEEIERAGGIAAAAVADVMDRRALLAAVDGFRGRLGPVDVLINNAGVAGPAGPMWDVAPDEWWRTVGINLGGVSMLTGIVLPDMIAAGHGRILNITPGSH
jgi:hypothetical protein